MAPVPRTLILDLCLDFLHEFQEGGSYLITLLEEVPVLVLVTIGPLSLCHEVSVTVSLGASVVMPHSTGCKPAFGTLGFKS